MSTRSELLAALLSQDVSAESHQDNSRGIPSCLLRHADRDYGLTVSVGSDLDTKQAVGSLVDALALAAVTHSATVTLRLARRRGRANDGIFAAVSTLLAVYRGACSVRLERETDEGRFEEADPLPADFTVPMGVTKAASWNGYLQDWYGLQPTGLASDLLSATSPDLGLRLYPQLTTSTKKAIWSLRLDGLQVGLVGAESGWLRVGSKPSSQRAVKTWVDLHGSFDKYVLHPGNVQTAAMLLEKYRAAFASVANGIADHGQPEHSLEAAVLRRHVRVSANGEQLHIPFEERDSYREVAWGSQIPTQWWPGGSARYLDALLRDGYTPWAIEMKVPGSVGGYGRNLRQGLTQAVLYREFLRGAIGMQPWFESLGLRHVDCQGAVLFPSPAPGVAEKVQPKIEALSELAAGFDISMLTVDTPDLH